MLALPSPSHPTSTECLARARLTSCGRVALIVSPAPAKLGRCDSSFLRHRGRRVPAGVHPHWLPARCASSANRTFAPSAAATSAPPTSCAAARAGLGIATFILDVLKGGAAVWLGGYLASLWMPAVPAAHRRGLRRSLRRPRPHVPHLAQVSRRQRRRHRLRRLSRSSAPGPRSPPSQPSLPSSASPVMSRSLPSSELPAFPSLPGSLLPARGRPSFLSPPSQFRCSSSSSTTEHPALVRRHGIPIRSTLNPHEPHRHLRFRRLGNRSRALASPPRRPRDHALGAQLRSSPARSSTPEKTRNSFPASPSRPRSPSQRTARPSPPPTLSSPSFPPSFCAQLSSASARIFASASSS